MSKKALAFQEVSAAIDLDSNGFPEDAFEKYIENLHVLSSILLQQLNSDGYCNMATYGKIEAQKILTVISACADRAKSALDSNSNVDKFRNLSVSSVNNNTGNLGVSHVQANVQSSNHITINDTQLSANAEQTGIAHSSSLDPISELLKSSTPRFSILDRMRKENAMLLKKYLNGIENAKDNFTKYNMQLELQRRLSENTRIAQSKHIQALKKVQDDRKEMLENAMKNLHRNRASTTELDADTYDFFLEVLQHEAKEPLLHVNVNQTDVEKFVTIRDRALQCKTHPVRRKIDIVKQLIDFKLNDVLKDCDKYEFFLQETIHEEYFACSSSEIEKKSTEFSDLKIDDSEVKELLATVEISATLSQELIANVMQILKFVYKNETNEAVSFMLYQFVLDLLFCDLWILIIRAARISNFKIEKKMKQIMLSCRNYTPQEFGIPEVHAWLVTHHYTGTFNGAITKLKTLPSTTSIDSKISILGDVLQSLCETFSSRENPQKEILGADALIPIISYVLVLTDLPQLVTEFQVMELFIHPMYMLSAQGYVLTTYLTAFKFLEFKKDT